MAEELLGLFITNPRIDEQQSIAVFNQHGTHGPRAKVVFIGGYVFLPQGFRNDTKHGATIEFEVSGMNGVYIHRS
jgi:hypothetical protein